jgi:acyl dehydratase
MSEFPKLTYDALTVGEEFVSDTHLVTPEDIETYAFAVDDHHPWFSGPSPFGGPVAHPTLLGNQALHLRHGKYIVHAETRPEGDRTRVVVEVWCQNQHGEKTAVGTASGLNPSP